jgi:hypothetical protein
MKNSIAIRSWLRKSSDDESRRRVTVRCPTKAVTTSNKLLRRGISRRRGLNRRRRWHILNERRRWHIRRELIRSWSIQQMCSTTVVKLSLEASLYSSEPQEETQRKTQRMVKLSEYRQRSKSIRKK